MKATSEIAVTPFPTRHVKTRLEGGFGYIEQKDTLTKLTVVYGNEKYPTGSSVYVAGDAYAQPWASKIQHIEAGPEFIFLPENFIKLYE